MLNTNQIIIVALSILLLGSIIVNVLLLPRFYTICHLRRVERQVGILYEIQNHTDPEILIGLYHEYMHNLENPDIDSLIFRIKESIKRNLENKEKEFPEDPEELKEFRQAYIDFFNKIDDVAIEKALRLGLF